MGAGLQGVRDRVFLMAMVCTHGRDKALVLEQNLQIACNFQPLSAHEMQRIREQVRSEAADGRYQLFKTTKKYDGDVGREQHGYPSSAELPL